MKRGWLTSEFWIAAAWTIIAGAAVFALLDCPPSLWASSLIAAPAVCVFVWIAGVGANNYGENRFQLKAHEMNVDCQVGNQRKEAGEDPGRAFLFGNQLADGESEVTDEEERGG